MAQTRGNLADLMNICALLSCFPVDQVIAILEETGRTSQRMRDLPAHVMVYYVIALALYRAEAMPEVLRLLLGGFQSIPGFRVRVRTAGKSGISQARSRLGAEPLKRLYEAAVVPVAAPGTPGAFYRGRRVLALDGFTLDVPDTEANREAFGCPESPRGGREFPRIRGVGLVEAATQVLFGTVLGSYAADEAALAGEVVPHLRPGMLCLADRIFPGYPLWEHAVQTGGDLVWRDREALSLNVEERYPDGSFRSRLNPQGRKGKPREGVPVRVIEYRPGKKDREEVVRIITSIRDWESAPAVELAQLFQERGRFDAALAEFRTRGRGARAVLRSLTPELVRQELYGLLLAHYALRALMYEASLHGARAPDGDAAPPSVRVARRHRTAPRVGSPSAG